MATKNGKTFQLTPEYSITLIPREMDDPEHESKFGSVLLVPIPEWLRETEGPDHLIEPWTRQDALNMAIAFRVISRHFNEMARTVDVKPWDDPRRSQEDRAAWRNAKPESLERGE